MKLFDSNACFGMDMVNHECVNHENFIVMEKVAIAKTAAELIVVQRRWRLIAPRCI